MKPKEIWSDKYGRNPREGLHVYLKTKIKDYKRKYLINYLTGFNEYIDKPDKKDSVELASGNFKLWIEFVKQKLNDQ